MSGADADTSVNVSLLTYMTECVCINSANARTKQTRSVCECTANMRLRVHRKYASASALLVKK